MAFKGTVSTAKLYPEKSYLLQTHLSNASYNVDEIYQPWEAAGIVRSAYAR